MHSPPINKQKTLTLLVWKRKRKRVEVSHKSYEKIYFIFISVFRCWRIECYVVLHYSSWGTRTSWKLKLLLFLVTGMSPCELPKIDHSMNHGSQNQINKTIKNGPRPRHITHLHEQLKLSCLSLTHQSASDIWAHKNLLALSYITFLKLCCQVARTVELFFLELECLSVLLAHKKNLQLYC